MRRFTRSAAIGAAVLLTAGLFGTVDVSTANAATSNGAVLQFLSPWYQTPGAAEFADGENIDLRLADTTRGIDARATVSSSESASFILTPPEGKPLTAGVYYLVGQQTYVEKVPTLKIDGTYISGELTILDLESDPKNGQITRFDAVIPGIGEFRFGEDPAGSVIFGARNVVFKKTYIGLPKTSQVENVHNTGTSAVSLGRPTVTGVNATSFSVSNSTCGATLAAGARCTFNINFRPKTAGPATAAVAVPVGAATQTLALTGSAFLGKTTISSSGNDAVNKGKTTTVTSGSTAMFVYQSARSWWFTADDLDGSGNIITVGLSSDKAFPIGTRNTTVSGTYSIRTSVRGSSCDSDGKMTVKQFKLDPVTGLPDTVDMTFTEYCFDKVPQHGSLQWQARSDVSAPAAPTGVRVASATPTKVKWTSSKSKDATSVVARLVQGDGAGATSQSGVPLVVTGSSAAVPKVPTGQRYTIAVFAVDAAGNVSKAGTTSFGNAPVTVMAPGRPTITGKSTGPGTATISFSPPTTDGGLPITSYILSNSNETATGTSSPLTLTDLPAGNTMVYVTAVNAAGKGTPSYSVMVTVK